MKQWRKSKWSRGNNNTPINLLKPNQTSKFSLMTKDPSQRYYQIDMQESQNLRNQKYQNAQKEKTTLTQNSKIQKVFQYWRRPWQQPLRHKEQTIPGLFWATQLFWECYLPAICILNLLDLNRPPTHPSFNFFKK